MEDNNQWVAPGCTYFIQVKIADNISEDDRKKAEGQILMSLCGKREFMPGVVVESLYRQNFKAEELKQSFINDFKQKFTDSLAIDLRNVLEEIIPSNDQGVTHVY